MFATFVWCSTLSIVKSMTSGATKVILLVVSIGLNQFRVLALSATRGVPFAGQKWRRGHFATQKKLVRVRETMRGCSRS